MLFPKSTAFRMFNRLPFRQEYHAASRKNSKQKYRNRVMSYYIHASISKSGGPTDNPLRGCGFITAADTAKPRYQASLPQGSELPAAQADEPGIQVGS